MKKELFSHSLPQNTFHKPYTLLARKDMELNPKLLPEVPG